MEKMKNKGEMPAAEKSEKMLYTYPVVCAHCRRTYRIAETNDLKQAGKPSHGVCEECMEEHYPEPKDDDSEKKE